MAGNRSTRVVCDAGPIIHLDELNCLDLLADFDAVLVPEAVWHEVSRHRSEALTRKVVRLTRVAIDLPEQAGFTALVRAFSLDAGEQEALALMRPMLLPGW
jgi:predicted nucleic acid-binding protein